MSAYEEAVPYPLVAGEVIVGPGSYLGFTVRETSKTNSAVVILYDNASAGSGAILEEIALTAGESTSDHYPRPGRLHINGVFAVIAGAVEGSVFA